jgi:hypothetical protein
MKRLLNNKKGYFFIGVLHGLTIRVNFMVKCVCGGFGSNGFVTKTQPFSIDGHYRTDIINGVDNPRSDSVMPLVLYTIAVQWLGH